LPGRRLLLPLWRRPTPLPIELENDEFWRQVDIEEEAKDEAADALEARLDRPDTALTADEVAAKRMRRRVRQERDDYRRRYHIRKRRDKQREGQGGGDSVKAFPGQPASSATPAVTITGMFEGYAGQEGSKPDTIRQWRSIINHLVAFLGHDDAKAVGLPNLVRWREHLRREPTRSGEPRSAKTINDSYLAAANALFAYGVNQLLIPANPATGLAKVRATKAPKLRDRDFTKAERKAILQAALVPTTGNLSPQRKLARRWVPWLCAYTGARVNEITQLWKEHIRQIEGVWTVHITPEAGGTKTNEARTMPIHEHLIAQGLLEAIKNLPEGPLFYNPDPAATSARGQHKQVGTFLAAWVRNDVGVTDPAIMPNHAWRHTFKTICLEAEIEERAADYMQGHASEGQGRRYGANTIPALANQLAKFPRFEAA
jgi:integrase